MKYLADSHYKQSLFVSFLLPILIAVLIVACSDPTAPRSPIEGNWLADEGWIVVDLRLADDGGRVTAAGKIFSDVEPKGFEVEGHGIFVSPTLSLMFDPDEYAPFNITATFFGDSLVAIASGSGFYGDILVFHRQ